MARRFALTVLAVAVTASAGCQLKVDAAPSASPVIAAGPTVSSVVDHRRLTEVIELIHTAPAHGLTGDYGEPQLLALHEQLATAKDAAERDRSAAALDARVTASLLELGHDVAVGRTSPQTLDPRWKNRRTPPDVEATLANAKGSLADWLKSIQPPHSEYAALQKALADLESQNEKGGWPPVVKGDEVSLRERLTASGELADGVSLEQAIASFQDRHQIKATGIMDAATLAAMNVPIDVRLAQLRANLERWRWMPDDLGEQHFIVNIPRFHLLAVEHGKVVKDIRVVVGKIGHETPIFSDEMEMVVFSPYWNIPEEIVAAETAPAIGKDLNYLKRMNIEITRVSNKTEQVNATDVDWSDLKALRGLSLRQRPGARNALGLVKFLFPNPFDVYLHDTPENKLFSRQSRAFSHGCMRVEEPEALAQYVLKDQPEWDIDRIGAAMHSGVERYVRLNQKIPVHVVYFTTWVDEAGGVHFQPDIYGYDKRQK